MTCVVTLMRSAGLTHTHQRPDRDEHITFTRPLHTLPPHQRKGLEKHEEGHDVLWLPHGYPRYVNNSAETPHCRG